MTVHNESNYNQFFTGAYGNNAETNYSQYINSLSPDQLINRYKDSTQADYGVQGGIMGTQDANNFQAYQSFKSVMGRDPTASEFSQVIPSFQGPNGHINGNAYIASLQQQYKSNPTLDPTAAQNNQKPADIQSNVTQQFQSLLGRAPTADELSHFTNAIQTNQTDSYGLSSFLKQQPEYTNAQDTTFRSGLNTELSNYDTTEFNREKGDVMSAYANQGMTPGNSPSLDYALTDLMGKIASNRSNYLAGISASQYQGNKDLAIGGYQNSLDQMYNTNQQNVSNQRSYGSQLMNQGYAGADYNTQMNQYQNMLNQSNQGRNTMHGYDYLNLGLQAANTGVKAYMGGG